MKRAALPLFFLVVLSSLTSTFKVQFPIASGSNMSVSYVVDIASLILRGPHATMIVGAASSVLLLAVEAAAGAEELANESARQLGRDIVAAAIWIPYFRMSKRVAATFVN